MAEFDPTHRAEMCPHEQVERPELRDFICAATDLTWHAGNMHSKYSSYAKLERAYMVAMWSLAKLNDKAVPE
jgi:hypothetical protein